MPKLFKGLSRQTPTRSPAANDVYRCQFEYDVRVLLRSTVVEKPTQQLLDNAIEHTVSKMKEFPDVFVRIARKVYIQRI